MPTAMSDDVSTLAETTSDAYSFGLECCDFDPAGQLYPDDAWREWLAWAKRGNTSLLGNKSWLMRDLKSAFPAIRSSHSSGDRYYSGISLKRQCSPVP